MGKQAGGGPQRSCIACRRVGDKDGFLRFVLAPDGVVTPDLEEKLPGRGAYTCQSRTCLKAAISRRQFERAFKTSVAAVAAEVMAALVLQIMEQRIGAYLALASKAGVTVSGGEAVERALRAVPQPRLLVLASDISASIGERLHALATKAGVPVMQVLAKDALGQLIGKESDRSAVVIQSDGFARSLNREFERYRKYLEEESGR